MQDCFYIGKQGRPWWNAAICGNISFFSLLKGLKTDLKWAFKTNQLFCCLYNLYGTAVVLSMQIMLFKAKAACLIQVLANYRSVNKWTGIHIGPATTFKITGSLVPNKKWLGISRIQKNRHQIFNSSDSKLNREQVTVEFTEIKDFWFIQIKLTCRIPFTTAANINLLFVFCTFSYSHSCSSSISMRRNAAWYCIKSLQNMIWAAAWDFQQFDILTSVDSDEPLQPPFKLRNSKWCSVSSLIIIEYSRD